MTKKEHRDRLLSRLSRFNPENLKHPPERLLTWAAVSALRDRGLHVENHPFYPPDHVAFPSGYLVILPSSVPGNRIYTVGTQYIDLERKTQVTQMPTVQFWSDGKQWQLCVAEYIPGPGPGDFIEHFDSETAAVTALMHYFFDENAHVASAIAAP